MRAYWAWAPPRRRPGRIQKKIDARLGALHFLPRSFRDPYWSQPPGPFDFWVLTRNKVVTRAPNRGGGALFFSQANRTLKVSYIGDCMISTVFLGIAHPPLLSWFETMVFYTDDPATYRYATWHQAMAGHHQVVAAVREKLQEEFQDVSDQVSH